MNASISESISSTLSLVSAKRPLSLAHDELLQSAAAMDNSLKAALPIFRSTAGPTTNGPIPTANSESFMDALDVAKQ